MTKNANQLTGLGRRELLRAAGLGVLAVAGTGMVSGPAQASPEETGMIIDEITGNKKPTEGKITLNVPEIAENAATVRTEVSVESPMTPDNYVKTIYILGEENPAPKVATFHLTPALARAEVGTRIRLAASQHVIALAVMNDGSTYIARKEVKVTVGGCK